MPVVSPSYKRYLENRQNAWDAEKFRETRKLDLYNETTFYRAFLRDLNEAKKEVVIYSPFISKYRSEFFKRTIVNLQHRNIAVFIFTRPLEEHEYTVRGEIKSALGDYEEFGACIIQLPGFIHAKAAIIDREILWDGSLNILSQRESKESMRRTVDEDIAKQMLEHLKLNRELAEGYKYQYERLYRGLVEKQKFNFRLAEGVKSLLKQVVKLFTRLLFAIPRVLVLLLRYMRTILYLLS